MNDPTKQAEMSKELTNARRALLAVGIIMFVMDMIFIQGVYADRLAASDRNLLTAVSAGVLAVFVALFVFAKQRPRLCLTLGLVIFWGIQIFNMVQDPKAITQGILLKIFFTLALVKGLKSANRAEELKRELEHVFE
jgi:hypothetical protein